MTSIKVDKKNIKQKRARKTNIKKNVVYSDINDIDNTIKKYLIKEIESTKENDKLQEIFSMYITMTHFLLSSYNELIKKSIKKTFLYKAEKKDKIDSELERKNKLDDIERKYINIIKAEFPNILEKLNINTTFIKYSGEDINVNEPLKEACFNCGEFVDNTSNCKSCGIEVLNISTDINYHDTDRINTNKKYKYSKIIHFKDTMNQFQGKQNKYIDKKVYNDLEKEFKSHGIDPKKVTKDHIRMFLQETSHTKHYEDINLLYHHYTGKPLPDISHLEESLLKDFELILPAYEQLDTEKINFLHVQYILYQLLRRHKFPCKEDDFAMLKTIDKKIEHDDCYEKICNILEWKFDTCF